MNGTELTQCDGGSVGTPRIRRPGVAKWEGTGTAVPPLSQTSEPVEAEPQVI